MFAHVGFHIADRWLSSFLPNLDAHYVAVAVRKANWTSTSHDVGCHALRVAAHRYEWTDGRKRTRVEVKRQKKSLHHKGVGMLPIGYDR